MLPRRGLRTHFTHSVEIQKAEVFDEEMQRLKYQEGHSEVEYLTRGENGDEVIYHIDYHGVMTHPAPTPKHPKHPKPQKTVRPLSSGAPPSS
ncbi:hypothetical protein Nepgr_018270 [Nepenthes gracilis]|uniref:Uncharacterized protein n=1 Tax=Nepenthes gracilis TaxID=150966 RepID=A0AAD3ST91_NEPGR|nr:hypothetical protein Nepgr_018270 [Nepenthes gracilis]